MLNWLLRYQPVMRMLDELEPDSVLDVGTGRHGLSYYWPGDVFQTDLDFLPLPGTEPESDRAGNAIYVASTAEALSFADQSVDVALSLDMVEHLPDGIRDQSLAELYRVARKAVILTYPVGRAARRSDRLFAALLRRAGVDLPVWLQEHLAQKEYPTLELAARSVPPGWSMISVERGPNAWLNLAVGALELSRLRRIPKSIEGWGRQHRLPTFHAGATYRLFFLVTRREGLRQGPPTT